MTHPYKTHCAVRCESYPESQPLLVVIIEHPAEHYLINDTVSTQQLQW